MKKLRNNKIRKLLAFMVALALMVSCMPSAYTISASEAFGDGTEDIFTDGEITSEPAAEESTPDVSSADQEETEQAQQSTLTYENDSVKVTAEALEDGALPQNTALKADSVNENSSVSYDTVSQKLSAAATDKGSSLRGFFAYDVYFADGDGNRVEPNGRVRVTFEYKTPAAPELTDAASTSVTVEKLHYNSSTGDTDVNTLQANEDLKVLNVNEGKQIQTLQVETGNAAVFAVMWDSPETADVEAEAVSGNEDEVPIASEELTDGMDISDEPEQDAAETPAAENPDAEPTEAPAEDPDVVEEPAEDIASPEEVPAADENGETSLIEVLGDDTNLRVSPSIEAEVLATVNAGTQFTLLDTVTAEDGATWYKVSWEGTEAYIRSDMAQVVDSSDEAEEPEDVLESEEVSYSQEVGNVVVTATAAKGVIPEGAQFVVTPIEKGSDQYADIEKQLHEGAENESYTVAGFLAYDISFLNDDGTKIEPQNGSVRVSIAYKEAEIPEDVAETDTAQENMNVSLVHFVEDANGNVTEVVNMSNDGQAEVSTTDNGEIESANFETESFSTFSVVWLADDFTSVQTTSSYGVEETVDSAKRGITKIYQWPSRITALKEVVNQFIRNTATSSSESNIGLAPFNTAVTNATETLLNVDKNKDTLIKNVSQLSVTGGTSPDTALNKALELLNNAKNPKYVILFTDGEPTGPSDKWDKNYQQKAETAAKSLKDKGIKVFTVGFALSERGQKFLAGDEKDSKNYPGIASEGCAFNATNAEDLAKIFEKIQHTVTEDTAIQNATVTDVIDPRFVILDKEGNAITADQLKDGKTVQVKDGTVYLDAKGNQCIKWERQRIPNKKENEAGDACWSRSIKVKAKDDYIGGNNVPTNVSPDSKISTGYGDAILPQPTVNVKADLTVDNLEKVIFLGDPTPTADLPDSMLSSILQKSKNYVYNETTKELEPVRVTRDDLTCSWAKDETFGNDELTDLESMAGDHPTEDPTRYYLKVTYNAGEPTETVGKKPGSTANTDGHIAGGETHIVTAINSDTKNYPDKEYGVYTIHIIKGQIQITKKLEDVAKKDGTFTFNIYKGSADESNLVTIVTATVKAGNTDAKFTMGNNESEKAIVAGLARGEYIVQEVSKSGYQLLNASNDSKVTNCKSEESEDIKFTIGTDNDNKNALEAEALNVGSVDYANYAGPGCVGKVDYTNKETVANVDFVKVDAADNNITINGAMFTLYKADESWTKGKEVERVTSKNGGTFGFEKLLPGNYLLNETKAATGYSLVTEPWKIVIKNNGEVTVTKNDGEPVIAKNSDKRYMIENAKVYSLPESGGPGTYGFTISGVAILATALLLFINNKRREEEAKRS